MATFAGLKGEYGRLLATIKLTRATAAETAARKVFRNANRYIAAGKATGVPWPLIGVLDLRESDCDPRAGLGQGDPWNQVSTHVPRGKGPWSSWAAAAEFYIHYDHLDQTPAPWAMDVACYKGEAWNGWGYRNKGIFSPYLWAGSNHYERGKYVADGQYSSSAVDSQLGIIPVLFQMVMIDPETYIGADGPPPTSTDPPPDNPAPTQSPYSENETRWIQATVDALMPSSEDLIRIDGNYGRLTYAAVRNFQRRESLAVDGIAGPDTLARMDLKLSQLRNTP